MRDKDISGCIEGHHSIGAGENAIDGAVRAGAADQQDKRSRAGRPD